MMEAINYFHIDNYEVLVTYSDNNNLDKIDALLKKNKIQYKKKKVAHIVYGVIPFLFSKHRHYRNIFIGYLYSESSIAIAYILGSFRSKIYILDDGVQILSFFSPYPRKMQYKFKFKIVLFFYKLIGIIKLVKGPSFFTIFNVSSNKYEITKNPLSLLKSKSKEYNKTKGIYIIGTNSSKLDFKYYSYEEYLIALHKDVSYRYPNESIFYCPHRGDQNLKTIFSLCRQLNITIFDTKISVEYDFIENNISPKLVIGFTSNALYTLSLIYPNAIIETVMYSLNSENDNKEIQIIRNRMMENGITTVKVL
ncbi:MAG: hypothetical protein PHF25_06060 [Candidatus Margulisbacteria bacterium]|nr:hypothetical protein [Candidatus Margulisiibacteriota bacterium]